MAEGDPPKDDEEAPQGVELALPESVRAGTWANFAQVTHSPYEFTLDFARLEFGPAGPMGGIVVARVSMSPLFIRQLIDALEGNWQKYAEKSMPQEVIGSGNDRDADDGEDDAAAS